MKGSQGLNNRNKRRDKQKSIQTNRSLKKSVTGQLSFQDRVLEWVVVGQGRTSRSLTRQPIRSGRRKLGHRKAVLDVDLNYQASIK